jgi:hypothetical protein
MSALTSISSATTQYAGPGLFCFDKRSSDAAQTTPALRGENEAKKEKRLLCALCRHLITNDDERIAVNGGHEHSCTNPAGYTFRIGCFGEAGGCAGTGPATEAHTWFKGYAWQIALCASCERHLGWRFEASSDRFYGLILERLVAGSSEQRSGNG